MAQLTFTDGDKVSRGRLLVCCVLFLVVACVTFAVLFAVYYVKHVEDDDTETNATQGGNTRNGTVCLSPNCVFTAGFLLRKMDLTADPCEDFSQFVCGKLYRGPFAPGEENALDDESSVFLYTLLDEDIKPGDHVYVKKMKEYYRTCLNTDLIEKFGTTFYTSSPSARKWPTLYAAWNDASFDLNDVIEEYHKQFAFGLFQYSIVVDDLHPTKYILMLQEPDLCITLDNEDSYNACVQYYYDVAVILGAEERVAEQDAKDLIDFEVELAKISMKEFPLNKSDLYNPTTLDQMTKDYPPIDWHRAIQASFNGNHMTIDSKTTVLIQYPSFFESLGKLLSKTNNRVIQNKYAFEDAKFHIEFLTEDLRVAVLEFKQAIGEDVEERRWYQCVSEVNDVFGDGLSKMFVDRVLSQRGKTYVTDVVERVKREFGHQIQEVTWMGNDTKDAALEKLKALTYRIGYPDTNFEDDDFDLEYQNLTTTGALFFDIRSELKFHAYLTYNKKLTQPVDNTDWREEAMSVSAQYDPTDNQMSIFAGSLQKGHFSITSPSSINYGAIGTTIGHEISHAFDNTGSKFDAHGYWRNWWKPEDLKNFQEQYQCFIDQYSTLKVRGTGPNINGTKTLGENIADNAGLRAAYRAYEKYVVTNPELPLPGLGLTTYQQFFVGAAQTYCGKHPRADLENLVENDEHAPERTRIVGYAMNSEDFAKAFNCPVGSPMNPATKCLVW